MMTKKDFEALAAALNRAQFAVADTGDTSRWLNYATENLADVFAGQDPRFDRDRFYRAAGHTEKP